MEQMSENTMLLFRARLLLEEGRNEAALNVLEAIVPDSEKQRQEVAYFLGWCYIQLKRWEDATSVLRPISPQVDEGELECHIDRERQAQCLYHLGVAAVQFTRFDEASRHFGRCIKLLNDKRVHLSPLLRIKAHYSLAMSLLMRGLLKAAIQQYNEALHHFLHVENEEEEKANIFYGLSDTYRRAEELDKARLAGEEALKRYVEVSNVVMEGLTRNLLGQIALEKKDYRTATDHFTQALAIGNAHGGPKMAMMNCAALADVRLAEDRLDEAKRYCALACDFIDQVKDNYFYSQLYFTCARVSYAGALQAEEEERRYLLEETIHYLEKAKSTLTGSDADADVAEIYNLWAQTLEELGLYQEAITILRSGYETLSRAQGPTWY